MIRSVAGVLALAALAGCSTDAGYELPSLPSSGGGGGGTYVPYAPYGPGYYGYGRGPVPYFGYPGYYDPRYYGSGAYGLYGMYGYQGSYSPYGGYYSPYPGYIVVPCVDNNHDGRCDRHSGNGNGDHHNGGDGNSDGNHHHNVGNDGRPRDTAEDAAPAVHPSVRPREIALRPAPIRPAPQVQPKAVEPAPAAPAPVDRGPRDRQDPRNDKSQSRQ